MTLSDSMFLFEITVKDLKSYRRCNEFMVKAEFEDIFKIRFKNSMLNSASKNVRIMKLKGKYKQKVSCRRKVDDNFLNRQSILITQTPSSLISNMKQHPLQISIYNTTNSSRKLGFSEVAWSRFFVKYIRNIRKNERNSPLQVQGRFNIYDEISMKRIATIDMTIKLLYLGVQNTNPLRTVASDHINYSRNSYVDTKSRQMSAPRTANKLLKSTSGKVINDLFQVPIKVRSESNIISGVMPIVRKSLSFSSFNHRGHNILQYIFGNLEGPLSNKVYCVSYFTVENDKNDTESPNPVTETEESQPSSTPRIKFTRCDTQCQNVSDSVYSLDISEGAAQIDIIKCKGVKCNSRDHRKLPQPPDDRILLDLTNARTNCCEKIEEVVGGLSTKMKVGDDSCFCTCECTFGFVKKTTYCKICGGYEIVGDELTRKPQSEMPIPCPFFHKLVDRSRLKTWSTSGSESKKKDDFKVIKTSSSQKGVTSDRRTLGSDKKSVESEKDSKKGKKINTNDRFKFNYGYKAPQIGHSKCVLPCSGTLDNVPKNMGWLWTSENIPGMKFRPQWKPGASTKHVVRLLRIAKNPEEASKKKRKDTGKRKRPLKRPLLIVHKKAGEFTVTMETMKNYSKPRALNQHPYEDKPVVTYTIGRTEEENRERLKKKERARRRLERAQRLFIQSTFKDMCNEICLKTYQQALGLLPESEDPACLCYPALPTPNTANMDVSCSCSEDSISIGSVTDSDEWIVEFTPPNAMFDPSYKGKKIIKADSATQYTYLDYRVKLLDRFGSPIPRFFKGPDGKQQCSDLGGFWSPDHKWLEINIDGYIAPDERWAPNIFVGPNGEQVDAETGKFQAANGKWLVVGIDGYVDSQNKWKYYPKQKGPYKRKQYSDKESKKGKPIDKNYNKSYSTWSCFGDVSPKQLSKLGISGHGGDRKLLMSTLESMLARGEDVKIPQPKTIFHLQSSTKKKTKRRQWSKSKLSSTSAFDLHKCHHSIPSDKGIVAVDEYGHKTYFRLKSSKNKRPKERLAALAKEGISLSSFHVPCFSSFISSEIMREKLRQRLMSQNRRE